jgi:hypothetical protein
VNGRPRKDEDERRGDQLTSWNPAVFLPLADTGALGPVTSWPPKAPSILAMAMGSDSPIDLHPSLPNGASERSQTRGGRSDGFRNNANSCHPTGEDDERLPPGKSRRRSEDPVKASLGGSYGDCLCQVVVLSDQRPLVYAESRTNVRVG